MLIESPLSCRAPRGLPSRAASRGTILSFGHREIDGGVPVPVEVPDKPTEQHAAEEPRKGQRTASFMFRSVQIAGRCCFTAAS